MGNSVESYKDLEKLDETQKESLIELSKSKIDDIRKISNNKSSSIIKTIPEMCELHYMSLENRKLRNENKKKIHPVRVVRGEIYNARITENIGSELCQNHLVIIIQNKKGNMYSEKVNVITIEGNGNSINENYQMRLSNDDLEFGKLDKNPSRAIITDILTIDKARLARKIGKIKDEKILELNEKIKKQLEFSSKE